MGKGLERKLLAVARWALARVPRVPTADFSGYVPLERLRYERDLSAYRSVVANALWAERKRQRRAK